MINKLFHSVFLTCQEATLLLESQYANQLPYIQHIRLKQHLSFCKNCRQYSLKAKKIDALLSQQPNNFSDNNPISLELLKKSIKAKIQEK